MRTANLFNLLYSSLALVSLALAQYNPHVVNTSSGLFRGYSPNPNVEAFLGIPFAAPPIGALRWQPPQPHTPNDTASIHNASEPYPGCYQMLFNTALNDKVTGTRESEDCLFLSVWKPATHDPEGERKLPVLLWIYGGGFAQGASNPNDGVDFVSNQQDVIVVSFNYRVNIFGFPTTPAVKQKNVGLLDQRAAVEWVAANINAFGGDPERIALAGQSAGATSVAVYAFAYPDDPIVKGLITMSGQPETNLIDDGASWRQVAEKTGCRDRNRTKELECMRSVPPRGLKRGISNANIIEYGDLTGGSPTVDNKTLFSVEQYVSRGYEGRFAKIPMWASHTRYEGDNTVEFNTSARVGINYTVSDLVTLTAFHCPTMLGTSYRVMQNVTTYRSVFSGSFPAITPYPWMRGAYHAADVYLMFGGAKYMAWQELGPKVTEAGMHMQNAVANFVRNPSEAMARMGWPKYDGSGQTLIDLFPESDPHTMVLRNATAFDAPCRELYAQFASPPK